jgi:hypothetical protein
MLPPVIRPMSKTIDGISIEAINAFRSTQGFDAEKFCYVEAIGRDSYVAIDRATQLEIDKTLAAQDHDPFTRTFTTPDGRSFTARVGVYERCSDGTKGAILIIYETATKAIADSREWEDVPFRFLWPWKAPGLLMQGQCFFCGDTNVLYYDVGRKKFYWEYEGD